MAMEGDWWGIELGMAENQNCFPRRRTSDLKLLHGAQLQLAVWTLECLDHDSLSELHFPTAPASAVLSSTVHHQIHLACFSFVHRIPLGSNLRITGVSRAMPPTPPAETFGSPDLRPSESQIRHPTATLSQGDSVSATISQSVRTQGEQFQSL